MSGPSALFVGARRALCDGPQRSLSLSVSGPGIVGARRSLCWGPLCVGARCSLCQGPALSVSRSVWRSVSSTPRTCPYSRLSGLPNGSVLVRRAGMTKCSWEPCSTRGTRSPRTRPTASPASACRPGGRQCAWYVSAVWGGCEDVVASLAGWALSWAGAWPPVPSPVAGQRAWTRPASAALLPAALPCQLPPPPSGTVVAGPPPSSWRVCLHRALQPARSHVSNVGLPVGRDAGGAGNRVVGQDLNRFIDDDDLGCRRRCW